MINLQQQGQPIYVPYPTPGPLNTRIDPHVIPRSSLQQSVNCWIPAYGVLGKRPGNANVSSGATGSGNSCSGMAATRFNNITTLLVQTGTTDLRWAKQGTSPDGTFTNISTAMGASAQSISVAQMFDPTQSATVAFICNGVDTPWFWTGPAATTLTHVATGAGKLPTNHSNAAPITPKYCATLGSTPILLYAGEPTEPSAVYMSDAFQPENFTRGNFLDASNTILAGAYKPLLVGWNDGIAGGDITGIAALGNSLMVYKQSAVYRIDFGYAVYGDVNYRVSLVSSRTGCLSPRSIVQFDYQQMFLGIDGVYTTDGANVSKISYNVPTFFDGPTAICADRTTAVATRYKNVYLIFYTDTFGSPPDRGLWFNLTMPDPDGYPSAGEIAQMPVNGVAQMSGPGDTGNFAWCSGTADVVGAFTEAQFSDFGNSITATFTGKSDPFLEFFGPGSQIRRKRIDRSYLALSIPVTTSAPGQLWSCVVSGDGPGTVAVSQSTQAVSFITGGIVGSAVVGTDVVGSGNGVFSYQVLTFNGLNNVPGPGIQNDAYNLSLQFQENSVNAWNVVEYEALVNIREREKF